MLIPPLSGAGVSAGAPLRASGPADPADTVHLQSRAGEIKTAIESLLRGPTHRWNERKILDLLKAASGDDLNAVLLELDCNKLFADVDDHCWGPKNRQELLNLLTVDRLGELSVAARARIIDGLMRGKTHDGEERAIRDVFLGTRGAALTELKNRIDAGNDYHDLHHLLHHDLDNKVYRGQLLAHFRNEAAGLPRERKVLSDIDDTFYCNWKDPRYPKGTVYPGVLQYYRELDQGRHGDLVFLTARPEDRLGVIKKRTHASLARRGVPDRVVLAGSLDSAISNEKIAAKKYENYREYEELFPEYDFVFTGDSGQGDVILSDHIVKSGDPAFHGAFIHDVVMTPPSKREEWRQKGILFFDTYVGAAVEAHQKGVMTLEGAGRVGRAAVADFERTAFQNEPQRQHRLNELTADLARLNALLPPDQAIGLPSLLPLDQLRMPEAPSEVSY